MAEWIEIRQRWRSRRWRLKSPLAMAEWIEIDDISVKVLVKRSPLAMAEWIEIMERGSDAVLLPVSASDGGVD